MRQKKILFVINPVAGGKSKKSLASLIEKTLSKEKFEVSIAFTEREKHASELTKKAIKDNFDAVIAVGGDGTINEVAQILAGTSTALGIIAYGSGNGLARHCGLFCSPWRSLKIIQAFQTSPIDTCSINNQIFLCTSGVGFDAYVSRLFAQQKTRGFLTYIKSSLQAFFQYKSELYTLKTSETTLTLEAFAITFANASQYGNNAFIAPQASIDDGYIDVCMLKPFPKWKMPLIGLRLFLKALPKSKYYQTFRTNSVVVERSKAGAVHMDGENFSLEERLEVSISPQNLYLIHA